MNKNTWHCLFEQSGTFKDNFLKLGFEAYDYDIENKFNKTDFIIDIFKEIELAYNGWESIFDNMIGENVFAFFPCTRFETQILLWFKGESYAQKKWSLKQKLDYNIKLHNELNNLYIYIYVN